MCCRTPATSSLRISSEAVLSPCSGPNERECARYRAVGTALHKQWRPVVLLP